MLVKPALLQEVKVSEEDARCPTPPVSRAQKPSGKKNQTWTETFPPNEKERAGACCPRPCPTLRAPQGATASQGLSPAMC